MPTMNGWVMRRTQQPDPGALAMAHPWFRMPRFPAVGTGVEPAGYLRVFQPPQGFYRQHSPLQGYGGPQAGQMFTAPLSDPLQGTLTSNFYPFGQPPAGYGAYSLG